MIMSRDKAGPSAAAATAARIDYFSAVAWRETVESIVVAVILAFLFRTFVAEAFVIPTGSMAPTLQGTHKDVTCEKCSYTYRAGASIENEDERRGVVTETKCPICGFSMTIDTSAHWNHKSFNGDRILVSKFDYDLHDPQRWDVIVFKFPQNAKQNYIKRLVGLPNETIKIQGGDLHIMRQGEAAYSIARKPDHKLLAMLQVVDDSAYIADPLANVGWPSRWQPSTTGSPAVLPHPRGCADDKRPIPLKSDGDEAWLRYRHLMPTDQDWRQIEAGELPAEALRREGELIADFYAYNAFSARDLFSDRPLSSHVDGQAGTHWAGDLALECDVEVQGTSGEVLLDLVEGGDHFRCSIDVASGQAVLGILGRNSEFDAGSKRLTGTTALRGAGHYHLRFSNVDDELRLWVDKERAAFDEPATYHRSATPIPSWAPDDPGDAAPLGVGCKGLALSIQHLRVLRDVFYIASANDSANEFSTRRAVEIFRNPSKWADERWSTLSEDSVFKLEADQFFPLGDNSPYSADARYWTTSRSPEPAEPFVERKLLVGKALLIYWPHSWNNPPFLPNFRRMGLIR